MRVSRIPYPVSRIPYSVPRIPYPVSLACMYTFLARSIPCAARLRKLLIVFLIEDFKQPSFPRDNSCYPKFYVVKSRRDTCKKPMHNLYPLQAALVISSMLIKSKILKRSMRTKENPLQGVCLKVPRRF